MKFNSLYYNTYRLSAVICDIKEINNYSNYKSDMIYLFKKNNINLYLNIELNNKKYNIFFEKENMYSVN